MLELEVVMMKEKEVQKLYASIILINMELMLKLLEFLTLMVLLWQKMTEELLQTS